MKGKTRFILLAVIFISLYFIPFHSSTVSRAFLEASIILQEYLREHVLLCLVPASFIAVAIANFVSQGAVIKYSGAQSNKFISYVVASVSGTIL